MFHKMYTVLSLAYLSALLPASIGADIPNKLHFIIIRLFISLKLNLLTPSLRTPLLYGKLHFYIVNSTFIIIIVNSTFI